MTEQPEDGKIEDVTATPGRARRWPWILVAFVVVAAGAGWATSDEWLPSDETVTTEAIAPNTAAVVRGDLSRDETYDGTLESLEGETIPSPASGVISYVTEEGSMVDPGQVLFEVDGEPVIVLSGVVPAYRDLTLGEDVRQVTSRANGTLTWLAPVGSVLTEGDVIAEIDGEPVILLYGDSPAYRPLLDSRTDLEGADVLQLEEALVRLGFDPNADMDVDGEFASTTADIVEEWQEASGMVSDGRVDLGEVVFLPGPAQVTAEMAEVGGRVSDGVPLARVATGDALVGEDVLQLEKALADLGYLEVTDDVFDPATVEAIMALQEAVGATPTGFLGASWVLFSSLSVQVDDVVSGIGSAVNPNSPVLEVASTELIVRVALPASDQGTLFDGQEVIVELPDGAEIPGAVASVASTATRLPGAEATFEVVISLDDPAPALGFKDSPVDVEAVTESVTDVLSVPVTALLALAEGGYAVEVVEDGSTRLVAVEPGFFARGMVEVTGDIAEGDLVVVP